MERESIAANVKIAWPEDDVFRADLEALGTQGTADKYGTTARTVRKRKAKMGMSDIHPTKPAKSSKAEKSSVTVKGDTATIITAPLKNLGEIEAKIREYGLDPEEWTVTDSKINQWEALGQDGEIVTLKQFKFNLKRIMSVKLISPASPPPKIPKRSRVVKRDIRDADTIVVEHDHQAPYHDPDVDKAVTALVADLQPDEHHFGGDGADFPTISRWADHPAAGATPQECIDEYHAILHRRVEVAPDAKRKKLVGNHDVRIEKEILNRSERLHGIAPAGEVIPALSLSRLLHLPELGIELVEDIRGWEHAEIELVPGRGGLVIRHGYKTGNNNAKKTLDALGRSAIIGHVHTAETIFKLVYPDKLLQVLHVNGMMARNDGVFPHFTVNADWHQGCSVVTRWPDGKFLIDRAVFDDGHLYWRDRRY